jgi:hypothetical protein
MTEVLLGNNIRLCISPATNLVAGSFYGIIYYQIRFLVQSPITNQTFF